jgi:hypothetical protein
MLRPLWLVLLVPAVCAPAADAATVKTSIFEDCRGSIACSKYAGGTPEVGLTFEAAPGERNRVRATVSGGRVLIADDGAAVTAGEGCTQVTEQQAGLSAACRRRVRARRRRRRDRGDRGSGA